MRPIQCRYCGTTEPTSEHFTNFRCSLRASEIRRDFTWEDKPVKVELEVQPIPELCAA